MAKTISWDLHLKSYFLEDCLDEYLASREIGSHLAAIKVWYNFPDVGMKDTGNYIVLYRHDADQFHPRINMQLKGVKVSKTNAWIDSQDYQIPAPFDNKKLFRLSTQTRFSYYDKHREWFYRFGVPHLLAVMIEKDFEFEITGNRCGSDTFVF